MAAASDEITSSLVRSLVSEQFPQWSTLPIRPVEDQGWDNRTFRAAWALWKALISSPEEMLAKYGRSRDAVLSDVADLMTNLA
ncbi:hypothetical protein [Microbacterium sp.]|uniref:hypothetical protein n=1 Tax=Microbacterium sp. TaxID=51671 RepID=UPI00261AB87C|nr:hypothetical protein [Microbacterium sp.]